MWQGDDETLTTSIANLDRLCLHTGNILSFNALRMTPYKNSSEEMMAALQLKLTACDYEISQDCAAIRMCHDNVGVSNYDRDELKITLKLFLHSMDTTEIDECLQLTCQQLNIAYVDQFILALPELEHGEDIGQWLNIISPVWKRIEELTRERKIFSVGVADLLLPYLQALYDFAEIKPCINHYSIEGCCSVPSDLQQYAKEKDIQLLTHNDPRHFATRDSFTCKCCANPNQVLCKILTSFEPSWAARYTVWVRRRSILSAKGYILQLKRQPI